MFVLIYLLDTAKGFVPAFFGPALVDGPTVRGVWLGACAVSATAPRPILGFRAARAWRPRPVWSRRSSRWL